MCNYTDIEGCCRSDEDCDPDLERCNLETNLCEPRYEDPCEQPYNRPNGCPCTAGSHCLSGICPELFAIGVPMCTIECNTDEDCDFGDGYQYACEPTPAGDICFRVCGPCWECPDMNICVSQEYLADIGFENNICLDFRGEYDPCQIDEDCPEGEICQIISGGLDYLTYCDEPYGSIPHGEECDPEFEIPEGAQPPVAGVCANVGVCFTAATSSLGGYCAGACMTNDDCIYETTSEQVSFVCADLIPGEGTVKLCIPREGSSSTCSSDIDCPEGEVCKMSYDIDGNIITICQTATPDGVAVGEQCMDDPATEENEERDCANDFCLLYGYCLGFCDEHGDCPEGMMCYDSWITEEQHMGLCLDGSSLCSTSEDCLIEGEVCSIGVDYDQYVTTCQDSFGDLQKGQQCDPFTEPPLGYEPPPFEGFCDTGICILQGVCSAICETDEDCLCPEDAEDCVDMRCIRYEEEIVEGTTTYINICANPGSNSPCQRNQDCPAGEVCAFSMDEEGNLIEVCQLPVAGGRSVGQGCSWDDECTPIDETVFCDNLLCLTTAFSIEGTCSALCIDDNDCPEGMSCQSLEVDEGVWRNLCVASQ
jgi:hypothetical protein